MNIDVAKRLIKNLEAEQIQHNQHVWLKDHKTLFIISESDRWSCATSGCAAGFIFLEESSPGMVFYQNTESVYDSVADAVAHIDSIESDAWDEYEGPEGTNIADWAAEKLGIDESEADFLFYQWGSTKETINRIRFLMGSEVIPDYDEYKDY